MLLAFCSHVQAIISSVSSRSVAGCYPLSSQVCVGCGGWLQLITVCGLWRVAATRNCVGVIMEGGCNSQLCVGVIMEGGCNSQLCVGVIMEGGCNSQLCVGVIMVGGYNSLCVLMVGLPSVCGVYFFECSHTPRLFGKHNRMT